MIQGSRTLLILGALIAAVGLVTATGCQKSVAEEAGTSQTSADQANADQAGAATPQVTPKAVEAVADKPETVYGAGVTQAESVAIADLLADPEAYAGKSVRVEGTVTDVCPKRGCWFDMAGKQPGQKLRFKVQDGVMVFPMDAKGKHAVAEGVVALQELSLEQTRKYLAYQAKEYGADVDPESVTEPMTIVRLDGTGAAIRE